MRAEADSTAIKGSCRYENEDHECKHPTGWRECRSPAATDSMLGGVFSPRGESRLWAGPPSPPPVEAAPLGGRLGGGGRQAGTRGPGASLPAPGHGHSSVASAPQPTEFHVVPKTSQEVGATETQISRNRGPRREPANWVCQGTGGGGEGLRGRPGKGQAPQDKLVG